MSEIDRREDIGSDLCDRPVSCVLTQCQGRPAVVLGLSTLTHQARGEEEQEGKIGARLTWPFSSPIPGTIWMEAAYSCEHTAPTGREVTGSRCWMLLRIHASQDLPTLPGLQRLPYAPSSPLACWIQGQTCPFHQEVLFSDSTD